MTKSLPVLRKSLVLCSIAVSLALVPAGCNSGKPDVVIPVVMKKYSFDPPVIRVKRGQLVELDVSTADVQHGFTVRDLGIKEPIPPHRPAKIIFKADRAGVFPMTCSIICGPGHDDMVGKIIVE
ncbi:MAG: cupredoxin domain-containing protein [Acidobacteriia bacterium]|nr:cupredoxin domain-containing protein [Terriglobia bacterium]